MPRLRRAWNLLLGHIGTDVTMLNLWSCERLEDFTMDPVRPRICSLIVTGHPLLKLIKHGVLKFERSVFMRLPRAIQIVCQACIDPRVEKNQQRSVRRRHSNQLAVAAFDDPGNLRINETFKRSRD